MALKYQIRNHTSLYFISFATIKWIDVFTKSVYKDVIVESLNYCIKNKGLNLHAWVVMTNHVHLILSAKDGFNVSSIIRDLKRHTSTTILKMLLESTTESRKHWMLWLFRSAGKSNSNNKEFQFWQQDNHPIELLTNHMLKQRFNYLHQNPVKAGWVGRPEDYLYSSAMDYCGIKGRVAISFID